MIDENCKLKVKNSAEGLLKKNRFYEMKQIGKMKQVNYE